MLIQNSRIIKPIQRLDPIIFLLSFLLFSSILSASTQNDTVIRAAVDIGMGGPKLQVAEIDRQTNKIVKVVHTERYFVNFYDSISKNTNNRLSSEIMEEGLRAFKNLIVSANSFKPEGIVAIATAAFRSAANGEGFANEIENETGIRVHIVDQNLEGILAFQAILSKVDINTEDLVVWDIGGGSIQFTSTARDGSFVVDCGKEGVGAFMDYIIGTIQQRSVETFRSPNPMSSEDIMQATTYACELSKKG